MLILNQPRTELAKLFNGVGAEIGVEQGNFSEIICKLNFNIKLYCIDPYKPYHAYVDHQRQDKLERFYWRARKKLYSYDATFIRKSSKGAVNDFEDCSLDFVYIDANHSYEYIKEDLRLWTPKVKPGGIVSGHDYAELPRRGRYYMVKRAVDEFVEANNIKDLTIYAGDEFPSWMFRKV